MTRYLGVSCSNSRIANIYCTNIFKTDLCPGFDSNNCIKILRVNISEGSCLIW